MNKNLFLTLSAFLFLFPLSGKATGTYRPETSVAGFIQLPGSGRQGKSVKDFLIISNNLMIGKIMR